MSGNDLLDGADVPWDFIHAQSPDCERVGLPPRTLRAPSPADVANADVVARATIRDRLATVFNRPDEGNAA